MPIDRHITLDASTAAKLFLDEDDSEAVRAWFYWLQGHGARFHAPHLLQYELGQILTGPIRGLKPEARGPVLADALAGVDLSEMADPAAPFLHSPPLTYYDAAYSAHATGHGYALATHDAALSRHHPAPDGVWTAARIRNATDPRFLAWLGTRPPYAGLAARVPLVAGVGPRTYLEVVWSASATWDDESIRLLVAAYDAFCTETGGLAP